MRSQGTCQGSLVNNYFKSLLAKLLDRRVGWTYLLAGIDVLTGVTRERFQFINSQIRGNRMKCRKIACALAAAVGASVLVANPAFAVTSADGNIDCTKVAAVASRTLGSTYVAPPGETLQYQGNYGAWKSLTNYESDPAGTWWRVNGSGGVDTSSSQTYAYCTGLSW